MCVCRVGDAVLGLVCMVLLLVLKLMRDHVPPVHPEMPPGVRLSHGLVWTATTGKWGSDQGRSPAVLPAWGAPCGHLGPGVPPGESPRVPSLGDSQPGWRAPFGAGVLKQGSFALGAAGTVWSHFWLRLLGEAILVGEAGEATERARPPMAKADLAGTWAVRRPGCPGRCLTEKTHGPPGAA